MRGSQVDRIYELMVIVAPDIGDEEITATLEQVATDIASAGGAVERRSTDTPWGRRRLAYSVRHESRDVREGIYALWYFTMNPAKVDEFERDMRLNERLMRHLTLQIDAVPELPPPPEIVAEGQEGEVAAVTVAASEAAEAAADDQAPEATMDDTATEAAADDEAIEKTADDEATEAIEEVTISAVDVEDAKVDVAVIEIEVDAEGVSEDDVATEPELLADAVEEAGDEPAKLAESELERE